jgi:transposase-like protein
MCEQSSAWWAEKRPSSARCSAGSFARRRPRASSASTLGLGGVQLVVSDAHAGLKKAIGQVLGCPWQRCSVHFLREALGHARREQQPMLAALLRPLFNADSGKLARELAGEALERLRTPLPKIAELLEEAEEDLLAFYCFPPDHWPKLRSTNPLERVNREIGRRTDVVGIFPNDCSLIRLAASIVIEQNDEWLVGRRYLSKPLARGGARSREQKRQRQRGDARAHHGLSSRRSCRRVTPRPGT